MEKRSLFQKIFGGKVEPTSLSQYKLINGTSTIFAQWSGTLFDSDVARSALRPIAEPIGKSRAKHIAGYGENMKVDPSPWIRAILDRPNPYMSMQDFLVKMVYQRETTANAFAYVKRDMMTNNPIEIYPIPYGSVELKEKNDFVFVKFQFRNGQTMTVPYEDCIHLRKDFNEDDFFGDLGTVPVKNIMDVISTVDQGVVAAVKNSAVIKWIMRFTQTTRPEVMQEQIDKFIDNYLSVGKATGVAAADSRYELTQVTDKSFVPNSSQMKEYTQRLFSYFGVNDAIVQNKATDDEWIAFYESRLEPIIIQLSNAFTWVFFSKEKRATGNRIIFDSSMLAYLSMNTKLGLQAMVDRGAMTPNEWRESLNLAPIEGGSKPLRRLDTVTVDEADGTKKSTNTENENTEEDESNA